MKTAVKLVYANESLTTAEYVLQSLSWNLNCHKVQVTFLLHFFPFFRGVTYQWESWEGRHVRGRVRKYELYEWHFLHLALKNLRVQSEKFQAEQKHN